jgi:hypothetical protein
MRIMLKLVLDCDPDAAWRAIRDPAVFRAASAPFTSFESLEPDGFPGTWPEGSHPVLVRAFGVLPVGRQSIDISYPRRDDDVRMMRDDGGGIDGPLALVTGWHHAMAVSPAPGGRTLYRDRLLFEAGPITPLLWPLFWAFWQWRAMRIRRLATAWR